MSTTLLGLLLCPIFHQAQCFLFWASRVLGGRPVLLHRVPTPVLYSLLQLCQLGLSSFLLTIYSPAFINSVLVWAEQRQRLMSYNFTRKWNSRYREETLGGRRTHTRMCLPVKYSRLILWDHIVRGPMAPSLSLVKGLPHEIWMPHACRLPGCRSPGASAVFHASGKTGAGGKTLSCATCWKLANTLPALGWCYCG